MISKRLRNMLEEDEIFLTILGLHKIQYNKKEPTSRIDKKVIVIKYPLHSDPSFYVI